MRIFPTNTYSLMTHYTPDEVVDILMKKSVEHRTFNIGRQLKLQSGFAFTTTFYRENWRYRNEIDETTAPDIHVVVIKKEGYSLLEITTEMGHDQQSIFVVLVSMLVIGWLIYFGSVMVQNGEMSRLLLPTIIVVGIILMTFPVMSLYVYGMNQKSKRFFTQYLQAR